MGAEHVEHDVLLAREPQVERAQGAEEERPGGRPRRVEVAPGDGEPQSAGEGEEGEREGMQGEEVQRERVLRGAVGRDVERREDSVGVICEVRESGVVVDAQVDELRCAPRKSC